MADDAAELAAIFGYEVPDAEPKAEKPEAPVETPEAEDESGEGEGEPSGVAAPETPPEEGSTAGPEAAISEEKPSGDRYSELLDELKRYRRFAPIIEMFEEEPALARQMLAQRLTGQPTGEPAPVAPTGPTAEQVEAAKEYWARRMQEDPVSGLAEFLQAKIDEELSRRLAPTEKVTARSAVRDFKNDLKASDPSFVQREAIFDALVGKADTERLRADPEGSLQALEVLAFGIWAKQQREAAARAAAEKQGRPKTKETPRTLSIPTSEAPSSGQGSKPKRQLTPEEQYLQSQYPEFEDLGEEESESPWGRG